MHRLIWLCAIFLGLATSQSMAAPAELKIIADAKFSEHVTAPMTPASERIQLFGEYKYKIDSYWSTVASARGWIEGVYAGNLDYPNELRGEDFQDTRVQDGYFQYRQGRFLARLGWQQVVWGETFGGYYADFINPKDLRYGVPQDLSATRLGTPMASFKYVRGHFSLQGVFLPQPAFNILPLPGADYAPPVAQLTGFQQVIVHRQKSLPFGSDNEWGVRVTQVLGQFDLSAFYFNGYDRDPFYSVDTRTIPSSILTVDEQHARVDYTGAALAAELGGFVVRGEVVQIQGRHMPTLVNNLISFGVTNQLGYALQIDFPTWRRLNFSLQSSGFQLSERYRYITARRTSQYISSRVSLGFFESSSWDTILTLSTDDQGVRLQSDIMVPIGENLEFHGGGESYTGPANSEFGRIARASNVYVHLRYRYLE